MAVSVRARLNTSNRLSAREPSWAYAQKTDKFNSAGSIRVNSLLLKSLPLGRLTLVLLQFEGKSYHYEDFLLGLLFSLKNFLYLQPCFPKRKKNMANHKSAIKRIRSNEAKTERNKYYHKTARNAVRKLRTTSDKKEAQEMLPKVCAMLDKLAKINVIHKNKASNLKSSITLHVNAL